MKKHIFKKKGKENIRIIGIVKNTDKKKDTHVDLSLNTVMYIYCKVNPNREIRTTSHTIKEDKVRAQTNTFKTSIPIT